MKKLRFLGCGAAFTIAPDNYQSNMLLEDEEGQRLLIDCGTDVRWSLHEAGLSHRDIHDVYVSHLHSDHVGGLEWLAFSTLFDPECVKPRLHISTTMVEALWDRVLSGGLRSIASVEASLTTYFEVNRVEKNHTFVWQGLEIGLVPTIHYHSNAVLMPTYGLFFSVDGTNVWISADTQFTPEVLADYYKKSDLIFHDCETSITHTDVHAHYDELVTLPDEIKAKMWLYHYNRGVLPDAGKDGFRGFVHKGDVFDLIKNR